MTEKRINEVLGQYFGWTKDKESGVRDPKDYWHPVFPYYTSDLNQMHVAEILGIDDDRWDDYVGTHLSHLVFGQGSKRVSGATALQRATAMVQFLGLYEDI